MNKLLIGAIVAGVLGLAGATQLAYAATAKPER
jgi:outer membrane murein-binding lipoprotein Lpp